MTAGDGGKAEDGLTLDALFRRAAVGDPTALALADPPNREAFTDGPPRRLSFLQADRAISALVARLRGLGLPPDAVVGLQLANTVESVVALLAVLRAGMIAAPLPLLWRRREIVAALGRVDARAIITVSRVGAEQPASVATEVAAELFPIRHVCAFGQALPDGVVGLDDCLGQGGGAPAARATPAVVTFEVTRRGLIPVARSHAQLIVGGHVVPAARGAAVLSTIPPASFAGIAVTLVGWLAARGPLHLHHAFDPAAFAAQCAELEGATVVLPAAAVEPLASAGLLERAGRVVALWRAPERFAHAAPRSAPPHVVDLACFGELGLDLLPVCTSGAVQVARTEVGTLALRGAMVPTRAFPPGSEGEAGPFLAADAAGFVDTGYPCRREGDVWTITAPPAGVITVGGYRLPAHEVEAQVARIDGDATMLALPHTVTGERLAGSARDPDGTADALRRAGVNPLIPAAFRRATERAA